MGCRACRGSAAPQARYRSEAEPVRGGTKNEKCTVADSPNPKCRFMLHQHVSEKKYLQNAKIDITA